MVVRVIVASVTLILSYEIANAELMQRAGSSGRGQSPRPTGTTNTGAGHTGAGHAGHARREHGVGGAKYRPYPGGYSDGVEIYNFGYPIGPYQPRFRSRASYHVVPRNPVAPKAPQPLMQVNRYAADYQLHAERLFRDGQFNDALRAVQHAVVEDPTNGKLYLFQAHVLLAMGDYATASNLIRYATRSLDPKDWGYLVENRVRFYKPAAYTEQIGKLEQSVRKTPENGQAQFLLGYQYLYLGRSQEAGIHLSQAIGLNAHRELAEQLKSLSARNSGSSPLEPIPVPPSPSTQP